MKMNFFNTLLKVLLAVAILGKLDFVHSKSSEISYQNNIFLDAKEKIKRQDLVDYEFNAQLLILYNNLSWPKTLPDLLGGVTDSEISEIFSILNLMTHHTNQVELVRKFISVSYELERRGSLSSNDEAVVLSEIVAARLFDEAIDYKSNHPKILQEIPVLIDAGNFKAPTIMELTSDGKNLLRKEFIFPSGGFVVIVGSPFCHFSMNAMRVIMGDGGVAEKNSGKIRWIAPQDRSNNISALRNWNKLHPETPLSIVYRADDWPQLPSWETPNFYFFNNGVLVDSFAGWPKEGRIDRFLEGLRAVGLTNK
ncbi:hypothetical protein [Janthinobacterium sp. JC611]|uniref:hypothetical protein n=1 Tax=Janthinobacterium sp. JC611 TaxID=2816201 RepID=UPI001BFD1B76|nr:hypothetical protein [Janthinobacterium sp. JC611]